MRTSKWIVWILLGSFGLPRHALAEELADQLGACASISNPLQRLKCYDDLQRPKASAPFGTLVAPIGMSDRPDETGWITRVNNDALTRKKKVVFSLEASETSLAAYRDNKMPARLIVRCHSQQLEWFVAFNHLVANDTVLVQFRIGNGPVVRANWSASQDARAYGPWDSQVARKLFKDMLSSDELVIRGDTKIYSSSEALFKISGLKKAVEPHKDACGQI